MIGQGWDTIPSAPKYVVVKTVRNVLGVRTWHEVIYPCADEVEAGMVADRVRPTIPKGKSSVVIVGSRPRPRWRTTCEIGQV